MAIKVKKAMEKNIFRQARAESGSNAERAESQLDSNTLDKADREIRAARDYIEAILHAARDPLLVLRADLTVESANDAFYKFFKVAPDVMEGRSIYELFNHQWGIPRLRRLLEEIVPRDGFVNDFKITSEFPNFGKRVLILNARRLDIPEGSPQGILLGIEDMTERQRLDEPIRHDEERFRALAMASAQMIWVIGPEGAAEEGSPSWTAFTGQTLAQCMGEGWLDAIHPDDRETVRKTWLNSIAGERVYEAEYRLRRADGVYRWVAARAAPVLNTDGSVREWIGAAKDITERKEAEQSMAQLAAIVESSSDAIIAADLDGVITSWNQGAERLYGYTAREAIGQSITMLIPPERSGEEESVLKPLRRGERIELFETVSRRKDGSEFAVLLTIWPIRNARGEVIGSSGIVRDITERKRAEEEIRAAYEQEAAARAEAELANRLKTNSSPLSRTNCAPRSTPYSDGQDC
jgi:two-component system CheB/CheR fusion protein